jgi:hypothetical protein
MLWRAHAPLSCPIAGRLCEEVRQRLAEHPPPTGHRLAFRVARSPQALPVILLVSRAYYQWPVHKSRREARRLPRRFWSSLVAHDSDDVTALGDFFQMSIPVAITVNGSRRMYFGPELVPITLNLGGHARQVNLTLNPGVLRRLSHSFTLGSSICGSAREAQARSARDTSRSEAAALRLEQDHPEQKRGREEALEGSDENLPVV